MRHRSFVPVSIENYPGYVNRSPHISDILAMKIWKYSMSRDPFRAWLPVGVPLFTSAIFLSIGTPACGMREELRAL